MSPEEHAARAMAAHRLVWLLEHPPSDAPAAATRYVDELVTAGWTPPRPLRDPLADWRAKPRTAGPTGDFRAARAALTQQTPDFDEEDR